MFLDKRYVRYLFFTYIYNFLLVPLYNICSKMCKGGKMKTDKELYKEFLKGDKESFEQLVIRHKSSLIYFISRYIHDINISEDISQDVFVYILLNKEKYNFDYSFKTYIYMIGKSRAINYLKKEKRIVNFEQVESLYVHDEEIENDIFRKEDIKYLKDAINKLKTDYQVVIYLLDIEGYSYKEVAKIMEKTVIQIKTLAFNARKKLKSVCREELMINEG